jgi:hypothetical protein
VHFDLPKWAYIQALLARGDRRVGGLLEKVVLEGYSWSKAMREVPMNPDYWVLRSRDKDEPFPWEIIDHGIKRSYLWTEYQKGLKGQETPGCLMESECRRCGIC